ncbi:MAG: hypothetical protein AAF560_12765 [Acidobacteriota bacterium]
MIDSPWIARGFQLAGAVNIVGILLFSLAFTNPHIAEQSPQVFSTFGQGAVILWGLAYLACAHCYRAAKWIVAVFAVEKLVYFGTWVAWLSGRGAEFASVFEVSPLTGAFFAIYGPNDLLFGLFFGWVFFRVR